MDIIIIGSNEEWSKYSWLYYVEMFDNVHYDNMRNISSYKMINRIFQFHFSLKINNKIKLPGKSIWYKKICSRLNISNNAILFFYDWNMLSGDLKFLEFLKKSYPKTRLVYIFTNLVDKSGAFKYSYLNKLKKSYDYVVAFDEKDSAKYGFYYHPLIFNINVESQYENDTYDLCFCGKAKTSSRLNQIHEVYKKAKEEGLNTWFLIHGVDECNQLSESDIIYNSKIHFKDYLNIINKSRCVVDITQDNSSALPLNIVAALVMNKKLITNNKVIENYSFYSPSNILLTSSNNSYSNFIQIPYIPNSSKTISMFSLESLLKTLNINVELINNRRYK